MTQEPTVPPLVTLANRLLWSSLGLGVLRAAFDWPEIARTGPIAFVLPVMVLTFAVVAFLIVMIARRRNWARIVFLALFVIGTLMNGPSTVEEILTRPVLGLCGLMQILLQGGALFLLFRPPASAWFRPPKPA